MRREWQAYEHVKAAMVESCHFVHVGEHEIANVLIDVLEVTPRYRQWPQVLSNFARYRADSCVQNEFNPSRSMCGMCYELGAICVLCHVVHNEFFGIIPCTVDRFISNRIVACSGPGYPSALCEDCQLGMKRAGQVIGSRLYEDHEIGAALSHLYRRKDFIARVEANAHRSKSFRFDPRKPFEKEGDMWLPEFLT